MTKRTRLKSKELGQYYTPVYIVDYIIEQTIGYFLVTCLDKIDSLKILDPACGIGIFLIRALEYLSSHFEKQMYSDESVEKIRRKIIANQLYGIDVDPTQIAETQNHLNFDFNLRIFNALLPPPTYSTQFDSRYLEELRRQHKKDFIDGTLNFSSKEEKKEIDEVENQIKTKLITKLKREFNPSSYIQPMPWDAIFPETGGNFNIILGNPPWGAALFSTDLVSFYEVGTQQVDSWSLFIERSLHALMKGGRLGFVVPNTLLLNENYVKVRNFILKTCKIIKIVNLGEHIFPEITQPCMIIILEKGPSPPDHKIEVIRYIPYKVKEKLMASEGSLSSLTTLSCSQDRFLNNPDYQFDIFSIGFEELKETIEKDLHHDKIQVKPLGDLVTNARGVEINKNGKIVQCSSCGWWCSPPSRFDNEGIKVKLCDNPQCHEELTQRDKTDFIVFNDPVQPERDKPFLAGHHIQRYYIKNHRYIDSARLGINYKDPALYQGPKLLLRKTGHGIKTVIDYEDRWVNQVIYFFKLKKDIPVSLEYIMGVLNSKLMEKFFFIEFADPYRQDFPHFTQKKFLRLPIKIPNTDNEAKLVNQVSEKARMLQSYHQKFFSLTQENKLIERDQSELHRRISQLEEKINELVFEIYHLTPVQKKEILSDFYA